MKSKQIQVGKMQSYKLISRKNSSISALHHVDDANEVSVESNTNNTNDFGSQNVFELMECSRCQSGIKLKENWTLMILSRTPYVEQWIERFHEKKNVDPITV